MVGRAKDAACLQEVGVVGGGQSGCVSLWIRHAPNYSLASSDFAGWSDAGSLAQGEPVKLEEGRCSSESTVNLACCSLVSFLHLRQWIP